MKQQLFLIRKRSFFCLETRFFQLRKSHVILLELLIAMGLTVAILSTLMFFYYEISLINAEMDKDQNESFKKLFVENRLSHILPKTVSIKDPSKDFHFFTSRDQGGLFNSGTASLVFSFDNGVQLDKNMSYHVIGRLFLDPEGNLTLAKWPAEKRWKENESPPMSKEILLENIDTLSFAFFVPPDRGRKEAALGSSFPAPKAAFEIPAEIKGRWVEEWSKEYHQLPAIVKITLVQKDALGKGEILNFAFPLPHTKNPVIYEE